jgi:hypothetical protein
MTGGTLRIRPEDTNICIKTMKIMALSIMT